MSWWKTGRLAASLFLASTIAVSAETAIVVGVTAGNKDMRDAIGNASLVLQARRESVEDPQELFAAARADYARLLGVLYGRGHYGGVILITVNGREAASIQPLNVPETIDTIRVVVNPGPLYRFSDIAIGPRTGLTELPQTFIPGAAATTGAMRDATAATIDGWREQAHAKAGVSDQRIIARHNENQIDATIRIDPGPKLNFGTVSIDGNKDVSTRRVGIIAGLEEGREFDPKEVARAERRLRRTGSFSSVVVEEAADIGPNNSLPMNITVVEATPRRFGFGAEYSTVEGVRLSGFWLHRNFLGGAERFRVDGEVSGITGETGGVDYSIGVRYERPATPRADVDLFATFGIEKLDEPDFISYSSEFNLGLTRYATDELVVNGGFGYLYSEVDDATGSEIYSLLTMPLGATLERRDEPLNPSKGVFVDLEATPFFGLDESASGSQVKLDARGYKTFDLGNPITAALRLQFGSIVGPNLADSPPFYRFYSGGGGTVRGQDYQSLAVDLGGNRSGGRSFAGLSAEARVPIQGDFSLVGFYDWGYVGSESFPDGSGDSHSGAGLGLRYNTGIGPIRLDVATPVSNKSGSSSYYLYVGIGQAF